MNTIRDIEEKDFQATLVTQVDVYATQDPAMYYYTVDATTESNDANPADLTEALLERYQKAWRTLGE